MQPIETQPNVNPQMTPDEAAASLAFATQLSQGLMPQNTPEEGDMGAETAPEQENPEEMENDPTEEMNTKFEDFKKEVAKTIKDEIGGLKKEIQDALKEDEEE